MEREKLLPHERKVWTRQNRETTDQLMIDKMIMKNSKRRMGNLNITCINYKKAYDMVPHTWILQYLKILKAAVDVRKHKH